MSDEATRILFDLDTYKAPRGYDSIAFRVVQPDFRSSRGFRWPFPGKVATSPKTPEQGGACPAFEGDGLCLAKTAEGAASAGIPLITVLIVAYRKSDVVGSDDTKLRVGKAHVLEVIDGPAWLRAFGKGADLSRADLSRANLSKADLYGANLSGASLYGANLSKADLSKADLSGASLYGANLSRANLYRADLYGANLFQANLSRANLYGANLSGASLYGANLSGANLGTLDTKDLKKRGALNVG